MDVSYINPFIIATVDTFRTMIDTEVAPGNPTVKIESSNLSDISGIIGLSGDAQGSIAIRFPKSMALKLVSKMLSTAIKIVDVEVTDGIGEISNIIAGNAKQYLKQFQLMISLPNVVVGENHRLSNQRGVPTLVVPFKSDIGEFSLEVTLKTK